MQGKNGFSRKLSTWVCSFSGYCSVLGVKIALPVGFFLFLPITLYLLFHEYRVEGFKEAYAIVSSPLLWGGMFASFGALMIILSRIVILPLKRFELHISELEKGRNAGPFVHEVNDEIGFLARRFNGLQNVVTNEIGSRDEQLSVLYKFTNATSGIFDIPTLMESFFTTLRTVIDYRLGAYVATYQNFADGRIYSASGAVDGDMSEEITWRLRSRASSRCKDFQKDKIGSRLEVTVLDTVGAAGNDATGHFIELPLICYGETIGVVLLITNAEGCGTVPGFKVFESMVRQASMVLERLLTHICAEERQLAEILSSMSEAVYLIDRDGRATSVNNKCRELSNLFCANNFECLKAGLEATDGSCPVAPEKVCGFSAFVNKIRRFGPEFDGKVCTEEIENDNGICLQLSVSTFGTGSNRKEGFVVTAKDITEDRLIQKRVMLSSKLAALGEMAAGIAHEINNPLQVMLANIELVEDSVADGGKRRLNNLKDGVSRIKSIVKDLLIFAREQTTEVEDIDVNSVVNKVVDIIGHQFSVANIKIGLDLDRRALMVKCNRNLFQQVLINLMHNAKDAIEEAGSGAAVNIRTALLPGGVVVMEVRDDGPGIESQVIDKIFDPFFTTKDVGKGTGLGLSVSRRMIEGMGGSISVASSHGTGTTFKVTLLQCRKRDIKDRQQEKTADYSCLASRSVIVVDDEEEMRLAIKDIISPCVGSVDTAHDGESALDLIMDRDYDLIMLDIKMPGMNGMELYRRISEAKPYLAGNILFLTGDTENDATASFIKLTGCGCLAKPFTREELLMLMSRHELEVCG